MITRMKHAQLLLTLGLLLMVMFGTSSCNINHCVSDDKTTEPKKFTHEYNSQLYERLNTRFSTNNVDKIKLGMSENKINELLNSHGRHQFSIVYSNQHIRCVEYIHPNFHSGYYFVFTNSILSIVCSPPKEEYIDIFNSKEEYLYTTFDRSNPQGRIRDILNTQNLLLQKDFVALMCPAKFTEKYEQSIDWGLTVAYLLVSPLSVIGKIKNKVNKENDETDYLALADQYTSLPFKILPHTKREEIEFILGEPKIVHTNTLNYVFVYYGKKIANYTQYKECFWIAITYEDDCVTGVFTSDFINREVIKEFLDL